MSEIVMKPYAWTITESMYIFWNEEDAKSEANHCGGTVKVVPLYTKDDVRNVVRETADAFSGFEEDVDYWMEKKGLA
jgi:hypothetical protein